MKMTKMKMAAAIGFAALGFSSAASAEIINNTTATGYASPFGSVNTATYGQTFTVGADHFMNSFSMFLNGRQGGSSLNLRGYVAGWDNNKATSILYTSATRTMGTDGALTEFAFDTGALDLNVGSKYVFFISVSDLGAQAGSLFTMPTTGNTYAGGDFVYYNNGTNFAGLTSNGWDCRECGWGDVAFRLDLSARGAEVPEPGSFALIGLGLLGFAAARRRSK